MKVLYLDTFSGISGDMFLGALLDLGVPLEQLERELGRLELEPFHLHAHRASKAAIAGVKFEVHEAHHHHHDHSHDHPHESKQSAADSPRPHDDHDHGHSHEAHHAHESHEGHHHHEAGHDHEHGHGHDHDHEHGPEAEHEHGGDKHEHEHGRSFHDIRALIQASTLGGWVKERAVAVFGRIARAEGLIHGQPPETVHFHEVGALDSIVDIVGACVALDLLGRPKVLASAVVEGSGFVQCAHGRYPVPAPATVAILAERGVPFSQCEEPHELVTPTGAALLAEFVEQFGPPASFRPEKIGYGLGTRDNRTRPNVLRAMLGQQAGQAGAHDWEVDTIAILETNLDDTPGEVAGYVLDKALAEGALDAFHTPIFMKKNRPAIILTILCHVADQDRFSELLLRETSALGVRRATAERRKLKRRLVRVQTRFGEIEVKLGELDGRTLHAAPEFESCRQAAETYQVTLREVFEAAAAVAISFVR